ncbi:MAG TPA: Hsp20/alpha crystallin family protein [Usitatibacter sp.]|nr:Hsp20/alpha crystallin family protein [Usitatibacter sp.]
MANIISRNDPFQELARLDPFRDFESFFPMPRGMRRWMAEVPTEPAVKLDVTEDEKAYHVKAELPGVKKEDIDVEIDGNQVSLSAEVKRESEKKEGETVVHAERYYGRQFRSFTLAREIDRNKAQAKFENGILELTLPKSGATPAQRVKIQ